MWIRQCLAGILAIVGLSLTGAATSAGAAAVQTAQASALHKGVLDSSPGLLEQVQRRGRGGFRGGRRGFRGGGFRGRGFRGGPRFRSGFRGGRRLYGGRRFAGPRFRGRRFYGGRRFAGRRFYRPRYRYSRYYYPRYRYRRRVWPYVALGFGLPFAYGGYYGYYGSDICYRRCRAYAGPRYCRYNYWRFC